MTRVKINKNLRVGLIFLLILSIAVAIYFDYESTIPHIVLAGYQLKSEMTFTSQGLLKIYPIGESKFIGYINVSKPLAYLSLFTYAYVTNSILYNNASVVYNQTYYFLKLTKIMFLKFNVSHINYEIYITTPYYSKLITQDLTHNGTIPINITSVYNLYRILENETEVYVEPTINVIINGSAVVSLNINGDTISVNFIKNTITNIVEKPVYGKLVSLNEYPISELTILYIYPYFYPRPLSENYSVVLGIGNFNYTVEQSSYQNPVALNISQLYSIAKNFTFTYNLTPTTPVIYLNFTVKYSNFTFKPSIEIVDNNGMIQVQTSNNSIISPLYKTIKDPLNYLSVIYILLPSVILIYLLVFTQSVSSSPLVTIMKKYRRIIVRVNDPPPSEKRIIRVSNFNELLKFSQILAKPILAHGNKLWINDESLIYIYELA
ncbi:DUF5305 family protein [Saccharolobus shibatae]|uniref:Uncharacterized protein n=1 Tax=Saccharolobus shibatae TaxID=2286 RepID=A0A8F5BZ72_9CREN|nr:DUF5305 family protein [Saccharolobus shibatae]QXJ34028.1 hypothetical protein J5U22_00573 [Saccharolobus shibatae]